MIFLLTKKKKFAKIILEENVEKTDKKNPAEIKKTAEEFKKETTSISEKESF